MSNETYSKKELFARMNSALESKGLIKRGIYSDIAKKTGYKKPTVTAAFKDKEITDRFYKAVCSAYALCEYSDRQPLPPFIVTLETDDIPSCNEHESDYDHRNQTTTNPVTRELLQIMEGLDTVYREEVLKYAKERQLHQECVEIKKLSALKDAVIEKAEMGFSSAKPPPDKKPDPPVELSINMKETTKSTLKNLKS